MNKSRVRRRLFATALLLFCACLASCDNSTTPTIDPKIYPDNHVYPEWSATGDSLYYVDLGLVGKVDDYDNVLDLQGLRIIAKNGLSRQGRVGTGIILYSFSPLDTAVCVGGGGLYAIALENGKIDWSRSRSITTVNGVLKPSWSPTGEWIAFETYRDDPRRPDAIWKVRPDGSELTKLSGDGPGEWEQPSWSPDGTRIVYVRYVGDTFGSELYVMDSTGENKKRLTMNDASNSNPRFSPDGTQICYESYGGDPSRVCVIDSDGSHFRALANGTMPTWSPDGNYIAYVYSSVDVHMNGTIWRMRADGSRKVQLTQSRVR